MGGTICLEICAFACRHWAIPRHTQDSHWPDSYHGTVSVPKPGWLRLIDCRELDASSKKLRGDFRRNCERVGKGSPSRQPWETTLNPHRSDWHSLTPSWDSSMLKFTIRTFKGFDFLSSYIFWHRSVLIMYVPYVPLVQSICALWNHVRINSKRWARWVDSMAEMSESWGASGYWMVLGNRAIRPTENPVKSPCLMVKERERWDILMVKSDEKWGKLMKNCRTPRRGPVSCVQIAGSVILQIHMVSVL